jgi:hypothetical protein
MVPYGKGVLSSVACLLSKAWFIERQFPSASSPISRQPARRCPLAPTASRTSSHTLHVRALIEG